MYFEDKSGPCANQSINQCRKLENVLNVAIADSNLKCVLCEHEPICSEIMHSAWLKLLHDLKHSSECFITY